MASRSEQHRALEYASQTGLLEIVSILLGAIAILLAIAGVWAFFSVRSTARAEARLEAKKVAEEVAETAAVTYLQQEMPALIAEYMELAQSAASDAEADEIARVQE